MNHCCAWLRNWSKMAAEPRRYSTAQADGSATTILICGGRQRRSMVRCGAFGLPAAHGSARTCGTITNSRATDKFLARAYPVMKGAAQFFVDTLVEEPKHKWLVTCPSISPENRHPGGVAVCAGPTMDMQILRDLFLQCINAAQVLGIDPEFSAKLAEIRARLAPDANRQGRPVAGMARGLGH